MIEVTNSLLKAILQQRFAASVAVEDHTVRIIECPGADPNWDVISSDRAVRFIVADLQRDYILKWEGAQRD